MVKEELLDDVIQRSKPYISPGGMSFVVAIYSCIQRNGCGL